MGKRLKPGTGINSLLFTSRVLKLLNLNVLKSFHACNA